MIARFRGEDSYTINSPYASARVGASETLAALVQPLVLRVPERPTLRTSGLTRKRRFI